MESDVLWKENPLTGIVSEVRRDHLRLEADPPMKAETFRLPVCCSRNLADAHK